MEREQIMSAALDLFSQYGIRKVSMNDIARDLNISKRTLYQHFDDKETLLAKGLEYRDKQFIDLWKELENGPYTVLEAILLLFREMMKRPKWYSRKFYEELEFFPKASEDRRNRGKVFENELMKILKRGVDEGVFEEQIHFGIVVKLAKTHIKMYYPSRAFSGYSNTEVYETILFAFLRGICTDKGRAILDRWFVSKHVFNIH